MNKWFLMDDNANESKTLQEPKSANDVEWLFQVRTMTKLESDEVVCVTGNTEKLGNWKFDKCVRLVKDIKGVWSKTIPLPINSTSVQFRYCVCIVSDTNRVLMIRNWEAHINARCIEKGSKCCKFDKPHIYGDYGDCIRVDRGWLSNETVIQLKLFNNALTLWHPKYKYSRTFIKITPIDLQRNELKKWESHGDCLSTDTYEVYDNPKYSFTEVANLNEDDCSFHFQKEFGKVYKSDDMLIFQTSVLVFTNVAFLIDIYICKRGFFDEPLTHIGSGYILPSALQNSEGKAITPITTVKHLPLGQLEIEYVIIKPLFTFNCDMEISFSRYWKHSWQGLDVGHRGLGTSFKTETTNCSEVRENTIASLKTAASYGADFVEFDVQLSRDLVPIVYHDFHVCISLKSKKDLNSIDVFELPVKELTLYQLQSLKIYHLTEGRTKNPKVFEEDSEEHQPFPTLRHILGELDPHVGFNIEIKWNMRLKDGTFELNNPFDLNLYIDIILEVVLKYGGNRRIIFSCFNPDICTMIRLKQNKYPVLFLTQGETHRYPTYYDPRCLTIKSAVQFATSIEILGINVHTEDLLRDASQVHLAFREGLVIFCWGEENNDEKTIKYLKELGLHGVIYDKIDKYKVDNKESIFLVDAKETRDQLLLLAAANSETSNDNV